MRAHELLRLAVGGALIAGATAWLACNSVLGIEAPELAPDDAGGGGDAGADDAAPSCTRSTWPSLPTGGDLDAGPDQPLVFALASISYTVTDSLGYDLDGTCTCPGKESCLRPPAATEVPCDLAGGRDVNLNSKGLTALATLPGFDQKTLQDGLTNGTYSILVGVQGWNRTANDPKVRASLFLSRGRVGDAGVPSPTWSIDPSSVSAGDAAVIDRPQIVDDFAYVSGGVLVASRLLGAKLSLGSGAGELVLDLSQTVVTARLVMQPDGSFTLEDGVVAARWPTKNLLKAIGTLNDPFNSGQPICALAGSLPLYKLVKDTVCANADLASLNDRDNTKSNCDAISFALAFGARPATFGKVVAPLEAGVLPCKTPANDDCF